MQIKELGHIVLYVSDLNRSRAFYRDTLGFAQIADGNSIALFSGGRTHHEMLLIEVGGTAPQKHGPEPGLYHIGFKIGDGPEAARRAYQELVAADVRIIGTTDHGVTHTIYIQDPDGNELELYADVSDAWKENPQAIMTPARHLDLS